MDTMEEHGLSLDNDLEVEYPALLTVPNEHIAAVWPKLSNFFLVFEDMEPKLYTRTDLFHLLQCGMMQLHASFDGRKFHFALITEIVNYPRAKVCRCILGSGEEPEKVIKLWPIFADWCRNREIDWVELFGRPGWERVFKPLGFQKASVVLFKRIEK